jgi:hypothetical protein
MGEIRYAYKILIGESEGKRPCGRPTCRLRELGWEDANWVLLSKNRNQ